MFLILHLIHNLTLIFEYIFNITFVGKRVLAVSKLLDRQSLVCGKDYYFVCVIDEYPKKEDNV